MILKIKEAEGKKIGSAQDVYEILKPLFDEEKENFFVIGMNTNNKIKFLEIVSMGAVDYCVVDPRILFKKILINNCSNFIIAHNHPSGNTTPSPEDKKVTKELVQGSKILNLKLLDHIVFAEEEFHSMSDMLEL